jgi:hypothetical protein
MRWKRFKTAEEIEKSNGRNSLMHFCYYAIKREGPMTAQRILFLMKEHGMYNIPSINQLTGALRRNGWVGQDYSTQLDRKIRQTTWYIRSDEEE